jgi:hypothetical protein
LHNCRMKIEKDLMKYSTMSFRELYTAVGVYCYVTYSTRRRFHEWNAKFTMPGRSDVNGKHDVDGGSLVSAEEIVHCSLSLRWKRDCVQMHDWYLAGLHVFSSRCTCKNARIFAKLCSSWRLQLIRSDNLKLFR